MISVPAGFFLYGWFADPVKMARAIKPDVAANKWVTGYIVRACLFETAAIYGLMIVFLGANPNVYIAFGVPVFLLHRLPDLAGVVVEKLALSFRVGAV